MSDEEDVRFGLLRMVLGLGAVEPPRTYAWDLVEHP
jgi:hypothetical protein